MGRAYSDITFTPAVRAMQTRMGSRSHYAALDDDTDRHNTLTSEEIDFIQARDGFYQASVSETGWPYVQFRGGPIGFLKALDPQTLAYADYRGNLQYISTGNLQTDNRVALFLVDHARRRRLKLLGRVQIGDAGDDPALTAHLTPPGYRARIERTVVITVEAFDWNCPQHITPRFTDTEIEARLEPLRAEIAHLKQALLQTGSKPPF
jgi:uncharacterized protein